MSIDILVLRRSLHRLPIDDYLEQLKKRLPEQEIRLARTPGEEKEMIKEARIVTGFEPPEGGLDEAEHLELFACTFAGTDHLPLKEFKKRNIAVTCASGVHGPNIAEHVIGSLLIFSRRFHKGWRLQKKKEWRHYQGFEFKDSTVTIVGMGAIGSAIGKRLEPFGVKRIGIRNNPEKDAPADEIYGAGSDQAERALADTDYLVLACPLTDETHHFIDESRLLTLPSDSVIVNVARGKVIDTEALVSALQIGEIRGAALDVTDPEPLPNDHPLWDFSNVLITPHNAGNTPRYFERLADIVAENVLKIEESNNTTSLRSQVV